MERNGRVPHPSRNILLGRVAYIHQFKPGLTLYNTYEGLRNEDLAPAPAAPAAAGPVDEEDEEDDEDEEDEMVPVPERRHPVAGPDIFNPPLAAAPARHRSPPTPEYRTSRRRRLESLHGFGGDDDDLADTNMQNPTPSPPTKKVSRGRKIIRSVSNAINAARHPGDSRPGVSQRQASRPQAPRPSDPGRSFANAVVSGEISIPVKP